ncbi:hypothetical protein BDW69DRAFT_203245 [Aspergillus filifer]
MPTPPQSNRPSHQRSDTQNFPAPLVLPGDGLAVDPDPPQDYQKWLGVRNQVTSRRRTNTDMRSWTVPRIDPEQEQIPKSKMADILDLITASYHGLPVKELSIPSLGFIPWKDDKSKISLNTQHQCIQVRTRPSPDGLFSRQLNLEDLLAAAMAMNYDLFESEDDEFICGRAYGGRRVLHGIEREHAWPASHCADFIEKKCKEHGGITKKPRISSPPPPPPPPPQQDNNRTNNPSTPLLAALSTFTKTPKSPSNKRTLWTSRLTRTTTHELSYCTYYACLMQGSASLSEDLRQPPYLCPVDVAKVLSSTKSTIEERYRALLEFCGRQGIRKEAHFAAFGAWLRASLENSGGGG